MYMIYDKRYTYIHDFSFYIKLARNSLYFNS